MHIPDGYLSPDHLGRHGRRHRAGGGRSRRRKVQDVLSNRTIPLLAIFAAMSFTIMMFNVPVPGGTTAHGVGGTLIAIVLGPWAAVIARQRRAHHPGAVLRRRRDPRDLRQLLQHGDRPAVRRLRHLPAARRPLADLLSSRRVWAAGIGAYVGITAVGARGRHRARASSRSCSPRTATRSTARTACRRRSRRCSLAHIFGASVVEALITGLGVAYLQKRHPEYLTRLGRVFATARRARGRGQPAAAVAARRRDGRRRAVVLLASSGSSMGGGDPGHAVRRRLVARSTGRASRRCCSSSAIFAAILVPLAWFVLPRAAQAGRDGVHRGRRCSRRSG